MSSQLFSFMSLKVVRRSMQDKHVVLEDTESTVAEVAEQAADAGTASLLAWAAAVIVIDV